MYDKRFTPHFRLDGHSWIRRAVLQGRKRPIKEGHEKLVVGKKKQISCYYTTSCSNMKRRVYWLLKGPKRQGAVYVLVHYLSKAGCHNSSSSGGSSDGCFSDRVPDPDEAAGHNDSQPPSAEFIAAATLESMKHNRSVSPESPS